MRAIRIGLPILALTVSAACVENPIIAPDSHGEDLEVVVRFSEEHPTTLTELEIEIEITDHDGTPVADFETVAVEFKLEGEESWATTELALHGGHFSADEDPAAALYDLGDDALGDRRCTADGIPGAA